MAGAGCGAWVLGFEQCPGLLNGEVILQGEESLVKNLRDEAETTGDILSYLIKQEMSIHVVVHGIKLGHKSKGYGERSYYEMRKKVEKKFGNQIVLVFQHQRGMRQ